MRIKLRGRARDLIFPANPEEITVDAGARTFSLDAFVESIEQPNGSLPARYGWSGFFPGRDRRNAPFVRAWEAPEVLDEQILEWLENSRVLELVITDTRIRSRVFIESYSSSRRGGHGDIFYSISFVEFRDIGIRRKRPSDKDRPPGSSGDESKGGGKGGGKGKDDRRTYTVKAGDTLSKIAKKFLGEATRWREIWEIPANQKAIKKSGGNADLIYPGTELVIPEK